MTLGIGTSSAFGGATAPPIGDLFDIRSCTGEAVYDVIKLVKEHRFRGGIYQLGLAEHGVGYVYDANNKALIPDSVRTRIEALGADIVAGRINVPSTR